MKWLIKWFSHQKKIISRSFLNSGTLIVNTILSTPTPLFQSPVLSLLPIYFLIILYHPLCPHSTLPIPSPLLTAHLLSYNIIPSSLPPLHSSNPQSSPYCLSTFFSYKTMYSLPPLYSSNPQSSPYCLSTFFSYNILSTPHALYSSNPQSSSYCLSPVRVSRILSK